MTINDSVATGFPFLNTILITDMPNLRLWNGLSEGYYPKLRVISIYDCDEFNILFQFNLFILLQYFNIEKKKFSLKFCLGSLRTHH